MGCVFPKPISGSGDTKRNIFKVVNIDQEGNDHLPGEIEITTENIVLHQKKKEAISWPIRTLRRYGFESHIFSFEAGRRCPTGEGIFAFRCDQAEQLFKLLQTNIQKGGNNANTNPTDSSQLGSHLDPIVVHLENIASTNSCPHSPFSTVVPSSTVHSLEMKQSKKAQRNSVSSSLNCASAYTSPLYINVPTGPDANTINETAQNAYICLTENSDKRYPGSLTIQATSDDDFCLEEESSKNLQYITLDMDNKPSSPVTQDSSRSPGYTTIDFQKTWALVQSTKPNIENDIGCKRRTRHNSTLYGDQVIHQ